MAKSKEEQEAYKEYQKYIKSKRFNIVKNAVFKRDNYACVCCGRTAEQTILQCHHKRYTHVGECNQDEIDDCITLCQNEHIALHRCKFNYKWYSHMNPRNRKDLRLVEIQDCKILVNQEGTEFYRADDYKELKQYKNEHRNNYIDISYYNKNTCKEIRIKADRAVS